MKRHDITIDINRLDVDQLEQLQAMLYNTRQEGWANKCKAINDRTAFLNGWMCDRQAAEYRREFCTEGEAE